MTMDTDSISEQWKEIVSKAKEFWAHLTDDDIEKARDGRDQLEGVVRERFGKTKEEAQQEVQEFWNIRDPAKIPKPTPYYDD